MRVYFRLKCVPALWIIGALVFCGCQHAIRTSPYFTFLNNYYAALASQPDAERSNRLDTVEKQVRDFLEVTGADPEMRLLHASICLSQLRLSPSGIFAREVLTDVEVARDAVATQTGAAAWVLPRSYIIVGDLMLLVAKGKRQKLGGSRELTKAENYILLSYYEVAAAYYARARQQANEQLKAVGKEDEARHVLHKQLGYARAGLATALISQALVLKALRPPEVQPLLNDLDNLQKGNDEVWEKVSSAIPGALLSERDTLVIDQFAQLNIALAYLASSGSEEQWKRYRLALRLAVLNAFHKKPGDVPDRSTKKVAGIAQDLVQFVSK